MKRKIVGLAILGAFALAVSANAGVISVNFTESAGHANQQMDPATEGGVWPRMNWNNTAGESGTASNLVDSAGATNAAHVTWSSSNMWGDSFADADATAGIGDGQIARGYLDDGGSGVQITVTGVPYANYTAVVLYSSDQGGALQMRDATINTGSYSSEGNARRYENDPEVAYIQQWNTNTTIIATNLTGDLTIQLPTRAAESRACVAGIQIVESTEGDHPPFPTVPSLPPIWLEDPIAGADGIIGVYYEDSLASKVEDPNDDEITFSKADGPNWLTVDSNGDIFGDPAIGDMGSNTFMVVADDMVSGASTATLYIVVRETTSPVWDEPVTGGKGRVDKEYGGTLAGKATDPDGEPLEYSREATGPAWLTVEPDGTLGGTPAIGDLGTNTFTVIADDKFDAPSSAELTIVVLDVLNPGKTISINFAENPANQVFSGGQDIGPLETDSANWNSTLDRDDGNLGTGTKAALVDAFGVPTTADISWSSANTYWNSDGTGDDQAKLAVGYLDDGTGISITVSNIPYASYRVYGLVSSDMAWDDPAGFPSDNPLVNGIWAYGGDGNTVRTNYSSAWITKQETGLSWSEGSDTVLGNYWTVETSGDLTITITKNLGRASISGLIIEELGGSGGPADPVEDLVIAGPVAGGMVLTWTGADGKPYGVQTNSNLIIGDWQLFTTGMTGDGGTMTVTNPVGPNQTFYRVISEVPE